MSNLEIMYSIWENADDLCKNYAILYKKHEDLCVLVSTGDQGTNKQKTTRKVSYF